MHGVGYRATALIGTNGYTSYHHEAKERPRIVIRLRYVNIVP